MVDEILIVGAGGFGREVLTWLKDLDGYGSSFVIKGFLDDNPQALGEINAGLPIVGTLRDYQPSPRERLVLALGIPKVKKIAVEITKARGARFFSLVHPSAAVKERTQLGRGVIVGPRTFISCDVVLGDFAVVLSFSSVGHDARIGKGATVFVQCAISGHAKVGAWATIGSHATVLPGKRVGANATVGAGSVVFKSVPPGITVLGNPAKDINRA
jgi:sugar O-acyltransferase (sialic acid O-acetyltransferase NeuD family)